MPIFPSKEWLLALAEVAETDPEFLKACQEWEGGPFVLVCEEDDVLEETYCFYIEPTPDGIKSVEVIDSPLDKNVDYEVSALYETWRDIVKGKLDPIGAIRKGLIKVKGNRDVVLKQSRSSKHFLQLLDKVETDFIDDES